MDQIQISKNLKLILLTILICFANLIIVGFSIVLGMWLDRRINSQPIVTIIMVTISVPISMIAALRLVKRQIAVNK